MNLTLAAQANVEMEPIVPHPATSLISLATVNWVTLDAIARKILTSARFQLRVVTAELVEIPTVLTSATARLGMKARTVLRIRTTVWFHRV